MDKVYSDIIYLIAQQLDWDSWTAFKQCSKETYAICKKTMPEVNSEDSMKAFTNKQFAFELISRRKFMGPMRGSEGNSYLIEHLKHICDGMCCTVQDMEQLKYVANEYLKYMKLPGTIVFDNFNGFISCLLDCRGLNVDTSLPKFKAFKNRILV